MPQLDEADTFLSMIDTLEQQYQAIVFKRETLENLWFNTDNGSRAVDRTGLETVAEAQKLVSVINKAVMDEAHTKANIALLRLLRSQIQNLQKSTEHAEDKRKAEEEKLQEKFDSIYQKIRAEIHCKEEFFANLSQMDEKASPESYVLKRHGDSPRKLDLSPKGNEFFQQFEKFYNANNKATEDTNKALARFSSDTVLANHYEKLEHEVAEKEQLMRWLLGIKDDRLFERVRDAVVLNTEVRAFAAVLGKVIGQIDAGMGEGADKARSALVELPFIKECKAFFERSEEKSSASSSATSAKPGLFAKKPSASLSSPLPQPSDDEELIKSLQASLDKANVKDMARVIEVIFNAKLVHVNAIDERIRLLNEASGTLARLELEHKRLFEEKAAIIAAFDTIEAYEEKLQEGKQEAKEKAVALAERYVLPLFSSEQSSNMLDHFNTKIDFQQKRNSALAKELERLRPLGLALKAVNASWSENSNERQEAAEARINHIKVKANWAAFSEMTVHLQAAAGLLEGSPFLTTANLKSFDAMYAGRKDYLKEKTRPLTTSERATDVAKAGAVGLSAGALTFAALTLKPGIPGLPGSGTGIWSSITSTVSNLFNPTAAVTNAVVSTTIGLAFSGLALQWYQERHGSSPEQAAAFLKEMEHAGFSSEKFAAVASEILELSYYRDCVLYGKKADKAKGKEIRDDFIVKIAEQRGILVSQVTPELIKQDMGSLYRARLDGIFHNGLKEIFKDHQNQIDNENSIPSQFFSFMSDLIHGDNRSEVRKSRFTQQLMVQWLDMSANLQRKILSEKKWVNRHPIMTAVIADLVAFSVSTIGLYLIVPLILTAVGASMAFPVIIPIAICIIVPIISLLITYKVNFYKRNKADRAALEEVATNIDSEKKRVQGLVTQQEVTEKQEVALAENLKDEGAGNKALLWFKNAFHLGDGKLTAMGSAYAWEEELSHRYVQSHLIDQTFSTHITHIVNEARHQTQRLQSCLLHRLRKPGNVGSDVLAQFIKETKQYLAVVEQEITRAKHAEPNVLEDAPKKIAAEEYHMKEKIRLQLLEIVSVVPKNTDTNTYAIPQDLIDFYTQSLGGSLQDLDAARAMANTEQMQGQAQTLNNLMEAESKPILAGSNNFRAISCLDIGDRAKGLIGTGSNTHITLQNIKEIVTRSIDFLASLDNQVANKRAPGFSSQYPRSNESLLYEAMLLQQLAELAHNAEMMKEIVGAFKEKGQWTHEQAENFQRKLHETQRNAYIDDSPKDKLVHAVRSALLYNLPNVSPESLLNSKLASLNTEEQNQLPRDKCFVLNKDIATLLRPTIEPNYLENVQEAIQQTKALTAVLLADENLELREVPESYLNAALFEVDALIQAIDKKLAGISADIHLDAGLLQSRTQALTAAKTCLETYERELSTLLLGLAQRKIGSVEGQAQGLEQKDGPQELAEPSAEMKTKVIDYLGNDKAVKFLYPKPSQKGFFSGSQAAGTPASQTPLLKAH